MSQHDQEPLLPRRQWKNDTDPLIERLIDSNNRNLQGCDLMGWLLHVVGRLQSGRYDRRDLDSIISSFLRQVDGLLAKGRSHCRIAIKSLLLLRYAPAAGSRTRSQWKDALAYNRVHLETLLRNSPSMKPFVHAMIRYAWRSARSEAWIVLTTGHYIDDELRGGVLAEQKQLGNWNQRLPQDCPWDAEQIIGFRLDHPIVLADSRRLPFDELHDRA